MASQPQALADPAMLSKIDRLFACNVGHHIDLPQIVVVGDQSSGKSSVLEGLTRLPFPRDSGLCTRFATQITFRRAPTTSINVSIIPGKDSKQEHIDKARAWKKSDLEELDQASFAAIMKEVQGVMGIASSADPQSSSASPPKTFSSDVLSIEVVGPSQEHLTVIDVPGIFQRVTKDVTTKEDKDFVKAMVFDYMKNPRSVMLNVVPANVDVATQLILEMAEDVDKPGHRTLGVLTKPDLVDKGAEKGVIDMVEGRSHKLSLGWCLVRNPGQKDVDNPDFDRFVAEESFFQTVPPWRGLPKDRVGVDALRERLQVILAAHIRREFPKVKLEVNKKLKECRKALDSMGPSRDTPNAQSTFLINLATRFQALTSQGLEAKYGDDCFSMFPELKIATEVVSRNDVLSKDFANYGHTYDFRTTAEPTDFPDRRPSTTMQQSVSNVSSFGSATPMKVGFSFGAGSSSTAPQQATLPNNPFGIEIDTRCSTRKKESILDIEDILHDDTKLRKPKAGGGMLEWMKTLYNNSRGFELGNFDPSLLSTCMKAQSHNWDDLAKGYISDVVTMTHAFIKTLLKVVCPEPNALQQLESLLMDDLMVRYKKAVDQVSFIMVVERFGVPTTTNHYFNDNLETCRKKRIRRDAARHDTQEIEGRTYVRIDDLVQSRHISNKDHTIQDLHDILESYYKVARKRCVDTLCMQAAGYHLISGPETPLRLFTPAFVSKLSHEQLEEIAGEDAFVRRRRGQLTKELEDLEKGRKILL
ncbi:Dynamin GTPAse [Neofusicoccum parvum]|uniref:Dynamin GTPAse n=1 Tax=Neofusicoccum parvum TaxID=310453 RepID=A0ACB5SEZ5_9PEZI|nr:Dynamin GTPAse [Neofusicoccum parvum]